MRASQAACAQTSTSEEILNAGRPRGPVTGQLLALLKYPFYPLFILDNGMNLISKSLTVITPAELLVIFAFAQIFWRNFVFAGFWPILKHEMTRPVIER